MITSMTYLRARIGGLDEAQDEGKNEKGWNLVDRRRTFARTNTLVYSLEQSVTRVVLE